MSHSFYDLVFLDDDFYMRKIWEIEAKSKGIRLLTLAKIEEFYQYQDLISKDKTAIYLDNQLDPCEELQGVEFAQILKEMGYENLSLATGSIPEEFSEYTWLNISGKDFPL
jgi:hypothetical protein